MNFYYEEYDECSMMIYITDMSKDMISHFSLFKEEFELEVEDTTDERFPNVEFKYYCDVPRDFIHLIHDILKKHNYKDLS